MKKQEDLFLVTNQQWLQWIKRRKYYTRYEELYGHKMVYASFEVDPTRDVIKKVNMKGLTKRNLIEK